VSHLGISEVEAGELIKRSVELAFKAVSEYHEDKRTNRPIWVAGSVGPYGACLHDGSEYSGSYISTMTVEELKRWHLPRIRLLVEASVDLLAVETIPSKVEAMAVLSVLNREFPHIPAYV